MNTTNILFSEAVDAFRLDLCLIEDAALRERLIGHFDHIREMIGDTDIKRLEEWQEEVKSLENDLLCAEGDHEEAAKKVDKHVTILGHLHETIGMAICLASKPDQRERLHSDYSMVEAIIEDDWSLDQAIRDIRERRGPANV